MTAVGSLTIHHEKDPVPPSLTALTALFGEARTAGLTVTLVSHVTSSEEDKALAKRRHDVKAALRTLGFTVKALESGYHFQDDKAAAKIDAIAKAVAILEREGHLLVELLGPG